ncbi:MAG: DUF1992 domain-containing protein [Aquabacterium sp.]
MSGSAAEDKRIQRLQLLDDHIGRSLRDAEAAGELKAAPSYGKPLDFGEGYEQTPAEFRMGFKILKDAGVVPAEVELMNRLAAQRRELAACTDEARARELRQKLTEGEQLLALRLEKLRISGSL